MEHPSSSSGNNAETDGNAGPAEEINRNFGDELRSRCSIQVPSTTAYMCGNGGHPDQDSIRPTPCRSPTKQILRRSNSFRVTSTVSTTSTTAADDASPHSVVDHWPAGRPRRTRARSLSRSTIELPMNHCNIDQENSNGNTSSNVHNDTNASRRSLPTRTVSACLPHRPAMAKTKSMRMLPARANSSTPSNRETNTNNSLLVELPIVKSPSGRCRMGRMTSFRAFSTRNNINNNSNPNSPIQLQLPQQPKAMPNLDHKSDDNGTRKLKGQHPSETAVEKRKTFRRSQSFRMEKQSTDSTNNWKDAAPQLPKRQPLLRRSKSFRHGSCDNKDSERKDNIPERPVRTKAFPEAN